ncbi:hypothetical protein MAP00_003955 [Monascus purpureus]|nr:hypothetical protein MAP00_003955 [Monascus purpureus]
MLLVLFLPSLGIPPKLKSVDGNASPDHSFFNPAFVSVDVPVNANIEGNTVDAPGALSPFCENSAKAEKRASVDGNLSPDSSFFNPAFVSVDVPVNANIKDNTVNAPGALSPFCGNSAQAPAATPSGKVEKVSDSPTALIYLLEK